MAEELCHLLDYVRRKSFVEYTLASLSDMDYVFSEGWWWRALPDGTWLVIPDASQFFFQYVSKRRVSAVGIGMRAVVGSCMFRVGPPYQIPVHQVHRAPAGTGQHCAGRIWYVKCPT
jgi:hypothetical protein